MLVRSIAALGLVVGVALTAGCAGESTETDGDTSEARQTAGSSRTTSGAFDADKGTANIELKFKAAGSLADLRAKVGDPSLQFWKDLKRPSVIALGNEKSVNVPRAGSVIFAELTRDGSRVDGFMALADSGVRKFAGISLPLSFDVTDVNGGFTLKVTNRDKVETRLLDLDVMEKGALTFELSAKEADEGVEDTIKESLAMLKGKDRAGRLLGISVAAADALEAK